MHETTVSILLPLDDQKNKKFYESFILQYSTITSSNLIINKIIEKTEDKDIYKLFKDLHGSMFDYNYIKQLYLATMLSIDFPQENESRGLLLDKIFLSMNINKINAKDILINLLNAKEFILLYSVFEGTLKAEFQRSKILNEGKFLREQELIGYIEKKLTNLNIREKFLKILSERSSLSSFKDLELFWKYFTHIRHLYVHNSGYITEKWLKKYKEIEKVLKADSISNFDDTIRTSHLLEVFEEVELRKNNMFYIINKLSNMFRNYIIYIMESLYLAEKSSNKNEL